MKNKEISRKEWKIVKKKFNEAFESLNDAEKLSYLNQSSWTPLMLCPCCLHKLEVTGQAKYQTGVDHACDPNHEPPLRDKWQCINIKCEAHGVSGMKEIFWNHYGEVYGRRECKWLANNDAPFGSFQRGSNVSIYYNGVKKQFISWRWLSLIGKILKHSQTVTTTPGPNFGEESDASRSIRQLFHEFGLGFHYWLDIHWAYEADDNGFVTKRRLRKIIWKSGDGRGWSTWSTHIRQFRKHVGRINSQRKLTEERIKKDGVLKQASYPENELRKMFDEKEFNVTFKNFSKRLARKFANLIWKVEKRLKEIEDIREWNQRGEKVSNTVGII